MRVSGERQCWSGGVGQRLNARTDDVKRVATTPQALASDILLTGAMR